MHALGLEVLDVGASNRNETGAMMSNQCAPTSPQPRERNALRSAGSSKRSFHIVACTYCRNREIRRSPPALLLLPAAALLLPAAVEAAPTLRPHANSSRSSP